MSGCPFHGNRSAAAVVKRPPGRGGPPWLGHFYAFVNDLRGFARQRRREHGDVFWARVYGHNTVFVSSAEANRWVFKGEHDYLRKDWPLAWRKLAGRRAQTVVTDPDEHERQMSVMRRALAPTPAMLNVYVRMIDAHLQRWMATGHVDPYVDVKLLALQTDAEAILGLKLGEAECRWLIAQFQQLVKGFSCLVPIDAPPFPFARAMASRRRLQRFFGEVIEEQLSEIEDSVTPLAPRWPRANHAHLHPLGQLLADAVARDAVDMEELRDQFQILIFAGHEFPGAAVIGACLELLRSPDALASVRREIDALSGAVPTLSDIAGLRYLDAFVHEVLRVYPPVPGGYRILTRDEQLEGHRMPRGWRIKFEPFLSHFDKRYWREPERFDPDRFLAPRCEHAASRGAYVPFGGGARACPGARYGSLFIKAFLVRLVQRCDMSFVGQPQLESRFGHVYQPHYTFGVWAREEWEARAA